MLGDLVADEAAADPFERAALEDQRLRIREALTRLSPRERLVLEERFGFDGESRTLEEIGGRVGVTRERVRQLEQQGLRKLAGLPRP